jgi:hypothetical protein
LQKGEYDSMCVKLISKKRKFGNDYAKDKYRRYGKTLCTVIFSVRLQSDIHTK